MSTRRRSSTRCAWRGASGRSLTRRPGPWRGRPALVEALAYLRAGDTLVVAKDQLGRSVRNLKQVADDLQARDVALRALSQGIDTATPGGRPFFHMLAAIAEFSVISTRRVPDVPAVGAAA